MLGKEHGPGEDILIARDTADTLHYLRNLSAIARQAIAARARRRVLRAHTAAERAAQLESYLRAAGAAGLSRRLRAEPKAGATLGA